MGRLLYVDQAIFPETVFKQPFIQDGRFPVPVFFRSIGPVFADKFRSKVDHFSRVVCVRNVDVVVPGVDAVPDNDEAVSGPVHVARGIVLNICYPSAASFFADRLLP